MSLIRSIIGALLILCVFILSDLEAATFKQAQDIYYKLGGRGQLYIYTGDRNASTNGNGVWISAEMLAFIRNQDELAVVLGHEIGHKYCGDGWNGEYCSDVYGVRLAYHAGFNGCHGAQILKRLRGGNTHPQGKDRYDHTGCGKG